MNNDAIPADIQTILTVIGRRNRENESSPKIIDLSYTNLHQAKLGGGDFEGVNLSTAFLDAVSLYETHLEGANLSYITSRGANLSNVFFDAKTNVLNSDFRQATHISKLFRETVANSDTAQWPDELALFAWEKPKEDQT